MTGRRISLCLAVYATAAAGLSVAAQARPTAVPTPAHVVRCLHAAGFKAQATTADGAKLVTASVRGITWMISLAPPKAQDGWSAYRKKPTAKELAAVRTCLK